MKSVIENPNPYGVLTENRLNTFENIIGVKLPEGYRKFLLLYNGGKTKQSYFYISEELDSIDRIHEFYALNDGPEYQRLDAIYKIFEKRINNNLLPFANDPFGNQLCISISGNNKGKIFLWNHDMESSDLKINTTKLSDTFSEFIDNLIDYTNTNVNSVQKAIKEDNILVLDALIDNNCLDIESEDEYERTMIENAAINNSINTIEYLYRRGAKLRNALKYAEDNAEFFDTHRKSVDLITSLTNKSHS